ncbi:MAG: AAA family ATPase [Bacillota bacterium]
MIITLSGACHSGKTTLGKKLEDEIDGAKFMQEIVRTHKFESIDKLREDTNKYFEFELDVIREKIEQEKTLSKKDGIYILDRNLIDNLYYYIRFIDESQLTPENKEKYNEFLIELMDLCSEHANILYDNIILVQPINFDSVNDKYRPKDLKMIQKSEYRLIELYTHSFLYNQVWPKIYLIDATNEDQINDYIKEVN